MSASRLTVPNIITVARIAACPAIFFMTLSPSVAVRLWSFALFVVAGLSDVWDGYLARRWEITTVLGGFLDSIADKLLVSGALFGLVSIDRAWAWAAFVIVAREIAVSGLRGVAAMDGVVVPPSMWGKIKANVQYLAIFMALLRTADTYGGYYPDEWAMLVAVAVTLLSGMQYFLGFARVLRADRAPA